MGVEHFWEALRHEGLVKQLTADKGEDREIALAVDGRVLAVDLSVWILQAGLQQDRQVHFGPTQSALKLCFERIVNWLRYGCIPVAVLEGESPPEKQELLQKRFRERFPHSGGHYQGNGGNSNFQAFCQKVAAVFLAMGLQVVKAPGEAEAMCAALDAAGLVQGVATKDSDALVMGAHTVYHTVELHARSAKKSELAFCELADVRAHLGLSSGGGAALLTLAELMGGDYHMGGAARVGPVAAWKVLKLLLKDKQDDLHVLEDLQAALSVDAKGEGIPDKCTGCKRCGHDSNNKTSTKKHTRKNPCRCCRSSAEDEDGGFFCCLKHSSAPCQCRFHSQNLERNFAKVLKRAQETPRFVRKAAEALQAYRTQMAEAAQAVRALSESAQQMAWLKRPSLDSVHKVLTQQGGPQGLLWSRQDVERKLRPLLRTWDAQHPGQEGVQYRPIRIQKLHGAKGFDSIGREWAYLLEWTKDGKADLEDDEVDGAEDDCSQAEAKPTAESGNAASSKWGKRSAAGSNWARFVRMSVVDQHWKPLVKQFEVVVQQAKAKKDRAANNKDAREAKKAGKARLEIGQTTMDQFLRKKKDAASSKGANLPRAADRQQPGSDGDCTAGGAQPSQDSRPGHAPAMRSSAQAASAVPAEGVCCGLDGPIAVAARQNSLPEGCSGSWQDADGGAASQDIGRGRKDAGNGASEALPDIAHFSDAEAQDEPRAAAESAEGPEERCCMEMFERVASPDERGHQEGSQAAASGSMSGGKTPAYSGTGGATWDSEDAFCGISPMASPSPELETASVPHGLEASPDPVARSPSWSRRDGCACDANKDDCHTPRGSAMQQTDPASPPQAPATCASVDTSAQLLSPKRLRTPPLPSCSGGGGLFGPAQDLCGNVDGSPAKRPREAACGAPKLHAMRALSSPAQPATPALMGHHANGSQTEALQESRSPPVPLEESSMHAAAAVGDRSNHPFQKGARRGARSITGGGIFRSDVIGGRIAECMAQGLKEAGTSVKAEPIMTPLLPQQRLGRRHVRAEALVISPSSSSECIVDLTQHSPPIDLTQS